MATRSPLSHADFAVFERAAAPVLDLIDHLDTYVRDGELALVEHAAAALGGFEAALSQAQVPTAAIAPAKFGLAVLLDARARAQPRLRLSTWSVLAHQRLFDGRDMSMNRIREFAKTARGAGGDYDGLANFLESLLVRMQGARSVSRRERSHWGAIVASSVAVFLLALVSYAAFLEYRFHAKITDSFRQELIAIGLDRAPTGADLARRLTQLADARDRVARAAEHAPFRRMFRLPAVDSETLADEAYIGAVNAFVPTALAGALEETLATEGDSLKLYDALRAWAVLTGEVPWSPDYLAGWLEDNQARLGWPGFARHAVVLTGPDPDIWTSDAEVMAQASAFASEAPEGDRVWLELLRAKGTRALAAWHPTVEIPELSDTLARRSGVPLETPIPGLFTRAGWEYAREFGIGVAVQDARRLAPMVLGATLSPVNQTPDSVQNRLHQETILVWQEWLADLRVQPFDDRERAILVSGILAQENNPVTRLLQAVWVEMGGKDRTRDHSQQVQLGREFGPVIQYIDEGGMAKIGRLFSTLNVALGALEHNAERGAAQLVSVRERADTIRVLQTAPRIIVQIAEDVLAQASANEGQSGADPLISQWQKVVYPSCREALDGRYPFGDGADASADAVVGALSANGVVLQFFEANLVQFIDTSASPWRWKPEARFSGLDPNSAKFFERAVYLSQALFDAAGQLRLPITLTALAERGTTVIAIGGQGVPVRATGDPAQLVWPGPAAEMGVEVSFRESSDAARLTAPGYWGLMRLLDQFRLRFRDDGARLLVDLRGADGRAFIEMGLGSAANPISARLAMKGFSCPPRL